MDLQPQQWVPQLRRPQGRNPPDNRRLDASYSIDRKSLASILPEQWLDDGVINTFINSLCAAQPGKSVLLLSTALATLPMPLPMPLAEPNAMEKAPTQDEIDEAYQPYRSQAATVTANRGLVFMPFCVRDHWILAVADFQYHIIRVYDSLVSCNPNGRVEPGWRVVEILPIVKHILSFCHSEDEWAVEHMWLPIKSNTTECGVYICLMALQHSYMPRFTHIYYVESFRDENGDLLPYELDECYWLAGRRIILQVCSRFLKLEEDWQRASEIENHIIFQLQGEFDCLPVQQNVDGLNDYHEARSKTLCRVSEVLGWFIVSIECLGSPQSLEYNEDIQRRTRDVVLTPSGEHFRNEIVDEAMSYAWHDVQTLINLRQDLIISRNNLIQEIVNAQVRLASRPAWETQLSLVGMPTGQPSGTASVASPSSTVQEESAWDPEIPLPSDSQESEAEL